MFINIIFSSIINVNSYTMPYIFHLLIQIDERVTSAPMILPVKLTSSSVFSGPFRASRVFSLSGDSSMSSLRISRSVFFVVLRYLLLKKPTRKPSNRYDVCSCTLSILSSQMVTRIADEESATMRSLFFSSFFAWSRNKHSLSLI